MSEWSHSENTATSQLSSRGIKPLQPLSRLSASCAPVALPPLLLAAILLSCWSLQSLSTCSCSLCFPPSFVVTVAAVCKVVLAVHHCVNGCHHPTHSVTGLAFRKVKTSIGQRTVSYTMSRRSTLTSHPLQLACTQHWSVLPMALVLLHHRRRSDAQPERECMVVGAPRQSMHGTCPSMARLLIRHACCVQQSRLKVQCPVPLRAVANSPVPCGRGRVLAPSRIYASSTEVVVAAAGRGVYTVRAHYIVHGLVADVRASRMCIVDVGRGEDAPCVRALLPDGSRGAQSVLTGLAGGICTTGSRNAGCDLCVWCC